MTASTSRMTLVARSGAAARVLVPAAILALSADQLLRAPELGLNATLLTGGAVLAWWWERGGAAGQCTRIERALLLVALLFGVGVSWRDNDLLRVLDLLGIGIIFALLPFAASVEPGRETPPLSLGRLLTLFGLLAGRGVRGPVPALLEAGRARDEPRDSGRRAVLLATLRGLALSAPLVLVFGSLLGAADPQFGGFLQSLVRVDPDVIASHTVGIGIGAWVAAALIGGALATERERSLLPLPAVSRSLGMIEVGLPLGLLNLVFGGFIAFQLPYFFGGTEAVLAREGLTFADYARRGFGELLLVSALVLPLLLLLEPRVRQESRAARRLFGGLAQLTLVLLVVIMGSAMHRMSLYAGRFGLTEDRFFATAFMTGIGVTALWFSVTVLRGAAPRFLPGAIAAWIGWLGALHLVNPERVIVETNLGRMASGAPLDSAYLFSLSTDAVPALVAGASRLSVADQAEMVRRMTIVADRGGSNWRAWHAGRARAQRLLAANGS